MAEEELDPRIQLELEKLNTETAEINKLELELEEANTTFRMLLNEATRRLKGLAQRLGNSVDRARPYHEALTAAQESRAACQRAAVAYQRASEIHAAAKETVALAEQRFKSNQHEWQFDSAWQEMLNHATIKVMDAENQKAESGREHHKRALLFNKAETKLQQLEDQLKKHVIKSTPYFDEKQLCQEQLATQKERIEYLQDLISKAKFRYSQSLRTLETISEEIHMKRRDMYDDGGGEYPVGPREPGVGAENYTDYSLELEMNDLGLRKFSTDIDNDETGTLEELRRHVRRLAARPVEGGETGDIAWETELNETVNRLDQMLMMRERAQQAKSKEQIRHSPKSFNYGQDCANSSNFENKLQSLDSTVDRHSPQIDVKESPNSSLLHEPRSYTPFEASLSSENCQLEDCCNNVLEKSDLKDKIYSENTLNDVIENSLDNNEKCVSLEIQKEESSNDIILEVDKTDSDNTVVLNESGNISLDCDNTSHHSENSTIQCDNAVLSCDNYTLQCDSALVLSVNALRLDEDQLTHDKLVYRPLPYTISFDDMPSNSLSENLNSKDVMRECENDNQNLPVAIFNNLKDLESSDNVSSESGEVNVTSQLKSKESILTNNSDFKEQVILDFSNDNIN